MDSRLTPSNGRVACASLKGKVDAERFVEGELRQINVTVADLRYTASDGNRERQLIYGEHFRVLEVVNGVAFGQAVKDGYVGYLRANELTSPVDATYVVGTRGTHLYSDADIKSPEVMPLTFGSRLRVVSTENDFFETDTGNFVPRNHLRPANAPFQDPASVAQLFFGTPYLWGGNSNAGIDCSGLVQAAMLACGHDCPGDVDMQERAVGTLTNDTEIKRGDLFFWKTHVAIAVDAEILVHANAGSMSTAYEPISTAIERIAAQGEGPVTSKKRI